MQQYFRITGSARYLPSHCISADALDRRLNLQSGWTAKHTGVLRRYQAAESENGATMARDVIIRALANASLALPDIDLLIDASLTVQQPIPCNAALIQESLGPEAAGIPSIDIHASCLSFLAALQMVNGAFAAKSSKRAIVVCAETPLRGVNWNEPESACLMGDGAVAVILEATEPIPAFALKIETFAEGAHLCECPGGGHRLPPYAFTAEQRHRYQFHMDGKAVHKMASRKLPPMVEAVLRDAGCTLDELDVIPHQASGPAIEFIARRLGIPRNKLHATISDHGNLVAAGMPYVLHEVRRQRPKGTRVMLLGTAAGYTQGAAIFTL
jgi:3-oxoacyl-[acyl-carrier-protein] synthase III